LIADLDWLVVLLLDGLKIDIRAALWQLGVPQIVRPG